MTIATKTIFCILSLMVSSFKRKYQIINDIYNERYFQNKYLSCCILLIIGYLHSENETMRDKTENSGLYGRL